MNTQAAAGWINQPMYCYGCNHNEGFALMEHGWVYRITFSRSLAEHINSKAGGQYKIQPVEIVPGRELAPGEKSATGAYALIARKKNKLLRCSLDFEVAQLLLADGQSRYLAEATIKLL